MITRQLSPSSNAALNGTWALDTPNNNPGGGPAGSNASAPYRNPAGQWVFNADALGTYKFVYSVTDPTCGTTNTVYTYNIESSGKVIIDRTGLPDCTFCVDSANIIQSIINNVNFNVTIQGGQLSNNWGTALSSISNSFSLQKTTSGGGAIASQTITVNPTILVNFTSAITGTNLSSLTTSFTGNSGVVALATYFNTGTSCLGSSANFSFNWFRYGLILDTTGVTQDNNNGFYVDGSSLYQSKSNLSSSFSGNETKKNVKFVTSGATYKLGAGDDIIGSFSSKVPNALTCAIQHGNNANLATTVNLTNNTLTTLATNNVLRRANYITLDAPSTLNGTYEIIYDETNSVCGDVNKKITITNNSSVIKQFPIYLDNGFGSSNSVQNTMALVCYQVTNSASNISSIKALFPGTTWSTIGYILAIPVSACLLRKTGSVLSLTNTTISNLNLVNNSNNFQSLNSSSYKLSTILPNDNFSGSGDAAYGIGTGGNYYEGGYTTGNTYNEIFLYIIIPKISTAFPTISSVMTLKGITCNLSFNVDGEITPMVYSPSTFSLRRDVNFIVETYT